MSLVWYPEVSKLRRIRAVGNTVIGGQHWKRKYVHR